MRNSFHLPKWKRIINKKHLVLLDHDTGINILFHSWHTIGTVFDQDSLTRNIKKYLTLGYSNYIFRIHAKNVEKYSQTDLCTRMFTMDIVVMMWKSPNFPAIQGSAHEL